MFCDSFIVVAVNQWCSFTFCQDLLHKREPDEKDKLTEAELEELLAEVMKSFEDDPCTHDPFMSPSLASDELLAGLPPIHIVVS